MKRIFVLLLAAMCALAGCTRPSPAPAPTETPAGAVAFAVGTSAPETAPPTRPPAPTATPLPYALEPSGDAYAFAWLSDTQHYSRLYPDIYYEMTSFLAREQARLKLQYIIHTGDLVHNYNEEAQWQIADGAMRELGDIPSGVLAGNHDVDNLNADYSLYGTYFGEARYAGKPWYAASFRNNRAHADRIDAGGTSYLFVYIGYPADADSLAWAKLAFETYPDCVGVLCVHDYFKTDLTLSEQGRLIRETVVAACPNVYLVLCGHRYNVKCVSETFETCGKTHTVYEIISNYQAAGDEGGLGYLRLIQVDERAGTMRLVSYSPLVDDVCYFDEPERQLETYACDPADEDAVYPIPWPVVGN